VRAAAVEGERLLWPAAAAAAAAAVAVAAAAVAAAAVAAAVAAVAVTAVPGLTSFTETGTVRNMLFLEYTRCKVEEKTSQMLNAGY
jgi:hypothetical protein